MEELTFDSSFPREREASFVEQTDFAWIPAFAGMTDARRSFVLPIIPLHLFQRRHEAHDGL